jgi:hypothetical protein
MTGADGVLAGNGGLQALLTRNTSQLVSMQEQQQQGFQTGSVAGSVDGAGQLGRSEQQQQVRGQMSIR